jgi:hypothetical protein
MRGVYDRHQKALGLERDRRRIYFPGQYVYAKLMVVPNFFGTEAFSAIIIISIEVKRERTT